MRVECRVFPFLQREAVLQRPSSLEVILAAPLPLDRASLVAVDRRLEEVRRLSDVQLPRARVSRPHRWEAPPTVQPPLWASQLSALNMEGVLGTPERMFSVLLGDSGPQIETDPLFKGRHQIPHRETGHPSSRLRDLPAGGCGAGRAGTKSGPNAFLLTLRLNLAPNPKSLSRMGLLCHNYY